MHLLLLLGVLSQLALGCGTVKTRSDKAAGVNFLQYHTFDFAEVKHPSDPRFFSPTNEARVRAAIRTELEKRGLRLDEPADLKVCVYLKTKTKTFNEANPLLETGSFESDLMTYYGLLYNNDWGTQQVVAYQLGTLVVHAVDVKQNRKVWEGIAIGVLERNPPEKQIEARIHEAVSGMFSDFPRVNGPLVEHDNWDNDEAYARPR